jgi:hypothetical protein
MLFCVLCCKPELNARHKPTNQRTPHTGVLKKQATRHAVLPSIDFSWFVTLISLIQRAPRSQGQAFEAGLLAEGGFAREAESFKILSQTSEIDVRNELLLDHYK